MKIQLKINNLNYNIQTEIKDGVEYMIVPVIMMRQGVHSGSEGAMLHNIDELGKIPDSWNGIPVTIQHPSISGQNVSANRPDQQIVGRVYNTRVDGENLKAKCWINVNKIKELSEEAYNSIKNKEPLEVSVGVFNDVIEGGGNYNGEHYDNTAINYRPDHLALLPGVEGACSWNDGCGIRNNINNNKKGGIMEKNKKFLENIKKGIILNTHQIDINKQGYRQVITSLQRKLDAMDTPETSYYLEELFDDALIYRVDGRDRETKYYRRPYEVKEDGTVEMTGEPVEVRKEINFNNLKKNDMKIEKCSPQKVDELIANKLSKFDSNNKDWLLEQTPEVLEKLQPVIKEKIITKEVPKEISDKDVSSYIADFKNEKIIELLPEVLQNHVKKGIESYEAKRKETIKTILDNTKDVWQEESLKEMDCDMLTNILKTIPEQKGIFLNNNSNGDEGEAPMFPIGMEMEKK